MGGLSRSPLDLSCANDKLRTKTLNKTSPPQSIDESRLLSRRGGTRELRRKLEMKRPKVLVSLGPLMPTEAQRNERKDSAMDSDSDFRILLPWLQLLSLMDG